ncbi:GntR family transcriptional regulator [Kocuria massiliensis]|uniref:GntR family transcriptional regulator n=1 Tax=Kocuria massiliensis TaxID=1926282 RepID=UPI0022B9D023|nr:GntR family transcriptional regulator [Kocuria massiliensis]
MPIPKNTGSGPVKRTLLRERTLERLKEAIMNGDLQPGERLVDEEIQEWLGVSRTPVREALSELARSGLVEMSPNRYTRVAIPQESEVKSTMQTIGVLMSGVIKLALPRLSDDCKTDIADKARQAADLLRQGDTSAANSFILDLWHTLTKECDSHSLTSIVEQNLDGLAFNLRVVGLNNLLRLDQHAEAFDRLGQAIETGATDEACKTVESGHLL